MAISAYYYRVSAVVLLFFALSIQSVAFGYSYAAAGKEPLIDGREIILQSIAVEDYVAAKQAIEGLKEEFDYLLSDHAVDLHTPMTAALERKDANAIEQIIDQAVVEEIIRRLEGAENNLDDYQVAKVLVVKSKLFLDLISPKLSAEKRAEANVSIQGVLESIGNPGVFGVGQAPADPERFLRYKSQLLSAIEGLKQH